MNKCILGLNIHSICISTVFSICISIKYAQYLYFYHSHFEQTVWIVFAHERKIWKSLRILIDAVHMIQIHTESYEVQHHIQHDHQNYKKNMRILSKLHKMNFCYQNSNKKKHFIETDVCCHVWLFLKAVTTLQNDRWSVGHSSQVDRKTWISLERGYNKHLCKPSVWNRIKTKLDPNPVLQVSFLFLSLVANRERQNMNM